MTRWHEGTGWVGWLTVALIIVACWSLVGFAVVRIFRGDGASGPHSVPRDHDPMQILDRRLACGDIDAAEYNARRNMLKAVR